VGSVSDSGADSNLLVEVTQRITAQKSKEDYYRAIRKSLMLSVDMAHAVHPNYSERHHA